MQQPNNPQFNLVVSLLDSPIAFNRAFAKFTGNSLSAGMLLSQLFYWAKTKKFGEFYKTNEELQEECFLGRTEFENARKKLIDLGVITLTKKGVPCRAYYIVNLDIILILLHKNASAEPANKNVENLHSSMQENDKLECMPPASKHVENQHTIINNNEYTENTTKNIPLYPQGEDHGGLHISDEPVNYQKTISSEKQEASINLWLSIIERLNIRFTSFEFKAIKFRATQQCNMQPWEIENEVVQLDKWAWEGFDIEDALRCGYRKIQSFRANLRKRIKQDGQGNPILNIDVLNNIRQNEIKQSTETVNGN